MIIILGLIILIAAIVAGVAGVLGNSGGAPGLAHGFSVLGYHVTGSGTRFLYGVAVGAIALFGLWLLLAGARRTSRRGSATRRELKQSRRETAAASQARDDLIDQRDNARAATASSAADAPATASSAANAPADGAPGAARDLSANDGPLSRLRMFGRPSAPQAAPQAAATDPERPAGPPAAGVSGDAPAQSIPAGASAPAE